jgi:hypothetical protein
MALWTNLKESEKFSEQILFLTKKFKDKTLLLITTMSATNKSYKL